MDYLTIEFPLRSFTSFFYEKSLLHIYGKNIYNILLNIFVFFRSLSLSIFALCGNFCTAIKSMWIVLYFISVILSYINKTYDNILSHRILSPRQLFTWFLLSSFLFYFVLHYEKYLCGMFIIHICLNGNITCFNETFFCLFVRKTVLKYLQCIGDEMWKCCVFCASELNIPYALGDELKRLTDCLNVR